MKKVVIAVAVVATTLIFLVLAFLFGRPQQSATTPLAPSAVIQPSTVPSLSVEKLQPTIASKSISITLNSPASGTTTTQSSIKVNGKTTPKAEVFINEAEAIANSSGNFSATISLDEGENTIFIVATDDEGNFSEKELTLTYNPS